MNRIKLKIVFLVAMIVGLVGFSIANAEVIRKLHPSAQLIYNAVKINDASDGVAGASTILDLDGGNYDKCSFQLHVTSGAANAPSLALAIQISADGGTTWANTTTSFTTITTSETPSGLNLVNVQLANIAVGPGLKLRILPTLSDATTFYQVSVWAMPIVD